MDDVECGLSWKFLKPPWLVLESPPPGDFAISSLSILDACGSPGADLPKREPTDFVGSIWRNTNIPLMDSVGEGEGGKIWENGIETCKISCMK